MSPPAGVSALLSANGSSFRSDGDGEIFSVDLTESFLGGKGSATECFFSDALVPIISIPDVRLLWITVTVCRYNGTGVLSRYFSCNSQSKGTSLFQKRAEIQPSRRVQVRAKPWCEPSRGGFLFRTRGLSPFLPVEETDIIQLTHPKSFLYLSTLRKGIKFNP